MNKRISRRDALKVAGTALLPILFPRQASAIDSLLQASQKKSNVLIILLDALSARHLSLHGYPRWKNLPAAPRSITRTTRLEISPRQARPPC